MEYTEVYWSLIFDVTEVISIIMDGLLFYFFIRPFLNKHKFAKVAGGIYGAVMIVLYMIPVEIEYPRVIVSCVVFGTMCLMDRRNIAQKLVLVIMMYLLRWIAHGVALVPNDIFYALLINNSYMTARVTLQFINYILVELLFRIMRALLLYFLIAGIHKVYINKRENISGKELVLFLSVLSTIMIGYFSFTYLSDIYESDVGQYIWNLHGEYRVLRILYQLVSCSALFIIMVVYQKIKERQKEEKENAILAEQVDNMKSHISEIEKLYCDIRALKHDMGNHIFVLENLILKNEKEEMGKYFSELKEKWRENVSEIKTGNPVTDVILTQKQKEIQEKGIDFRCEFYYPKETKIEAFDVSVILNNALINAMEGITGCSDPYISISSYRKKNAYIIEIRNSIKKKVVLNEETGLPETTKKDKVNHGFGLVGIRKIAQKYYGGIDIEQNKNNFLLSVMLMME